MFIHSSRTGDDLLLKLFLNTFCINYRGVDSKLGVSYFSYSLLLISVVIYLKKYIYIYPSKYSFLLVETLSCIYVGLHPCIGTNSPFFLLKTLLLVVRIQIKHWSHILTQTENTLMTSPGLLPQTLQSHRGHYTAGHKSS